MKRRVSPVTRLIREDSSGSAPCRCGTGRFCGVHGTYGAIGGGEFREEVSRLQRQQCGGGFRIIRKGIQST